MQKYAFFSEKSVPHSALIPSGNFYVGINLYLPPGRNFTTPDISSSKSALAISLTVLFR